MLERGKLDRGVIEIVDTESLVPKGHLLRKIDEAVDFNRLYEGKNVVVKKNFLEPEDDLVAFNGVGESSLERDKELYQYTYEDITAMLRENMKSTNVEETIDRFFTLMWEVGNL